MSIYLAHRRETCNALQHVTNRNVFRNCLKLFPPITGFRILSSREFQTDGLADKRFANLWYVTFALVYCAISDALNRTLLHVILRAESIVAACDPPCLNGGTCYSQQDPLKPGTKVYLCYCTEAFHGLSCEKERGIYDLKQV